MEKRKYDSIWQVLNARNGVEDKYYVIEHLIDEMIDTEMWEQSCKGCGHHDTMFKTIVQSDEWKSWYKYNSEKMLYDVDECQELGIMSKRHWIDFMEYIRNFGGNCNHVFTEKSKDTKECKFCKICISIG
ncbi:MAG: hypothetical protein ACP5N7_05860 [Candidatus Pacearchaeota archaeon]